jgi:hypothetical protein
MSLWHLSWLYMMNLMWNMAPKWQLSDLILNQIWLEIFEYQLHHYGWLLSAQTVIRNKQSAKKIVFFWFSQSWCQQLERNFSVKSSSLWHLLFPANLFKTIFKVDCGLKKQNWIVVCFVRSAIVPYKMMQSSWSTHLPRFSTSRELGKSTRFASRAKNCKLFWGNMMWALIFYLGNDVIKCLAIFSSTLADALIKRTNIGTSLWVYQTVNS